MSTEYVADSIPAGCKQTEVGVIPEDWKVASIVEIAPLQRGFDLPTSQLKDGPYPVVYSNGVMNFHESAMVRGPGVTTGRSGTLGKVHYIETDYWPHNTSLWVTSFKGNNPLFIFYLYTSIGFERFSSGSGVPTLNRNDAHSFHTAIPSSVDEQQSIATALSDTDALTESLEQLIAKKRQIKQGAMQELLTGKRRLPGFGEGKEYKHTEVGVIPEDWECLAIGNSIDLLTGFPFSSIGYSKSGVRLLRGSNVKRGVTDWSEEGTEFWPAITSEIRRYVLKAGDIVIAMDGSLVGRSFAMLAESDVPAVLLQRVARIRSESIEQNFLKAWICSQRFTEHCDSVKTVTAIPHISPADIKSFKIALPPTTAEQAAIATILSDMDAEITTLEEKLVKTRQIKQGMMQELLTGRIRLV